MNKMTLFKKLLDFTTLVTCVNLVIARTLPPVREIDKCQAVLVNACFPP